MKVKVVLTFLVHYVLKSGQIYNGQNLLPGIVHAESFEEAQKKVNFYLESINSSYEIIGMKQIGGGHLA